MHIAATRFPYGEGGDGIFYATDKGHTHGTFGAPTRIASNAYGEPQLKVYNGDLYLVAVKNWCCVGDGTVVMRTNKSGTWTQATVGPGQNPSFQMTSDGYARVLYERGDAATGLYYANAGTHKGSFTTAHIAGTNSNDGGPLLALTLNTGANHLAARQQRRRKLEVHLCDPGGWHSFFTVPGSTSNMAGGDRGAADGLRPRRARRASTSPTTTAAGANLRGTWCAETVASNVHASAVASAGGPAAAIDIVVDPERRHLVRVRAFPGTVTNRGL